MTIDLIEAQDILWRAVMNSPKGHRNPTDGEMCLYTSEDNPDHHCIVGQVLADAGLEVPPDHTETGGFGSLSSPYVERGELTQLAADFLADCQRVFDWGGGEVCAGDTPTWRQALEICRRRGYLDSDYKSSAMLLM